MKEIFSLLDNQVQEVVNIQRELVSRPALGPDSGGQGEKDKADYLINYLKKIGCDEIYELNAPDKRVSCGYRPNIVAKIYGRNRSKTLWIISHTDIVPPGEQALWNTDPFVLEVQGDLLIGRGVEDNHQGIVSSLLLASSIRQLNLIPDLSLGLLFVADEETGSRYGLDYVLTNHGHLFSKDDLFLVPDCGEKTSDLVEVAEKSMLWIKVSVIGKQCHASTPSKGINSLVACSDFVLKIQQLYSEFDIKNELFSPPVSTFSPTKKEANVPNVNTIPGKDVFYIDCRVLPEYDLDEIIKAIKDLGKEVEQKYKVKTEYETVYIEQAAPPTNPQSEVVSRLCRAIEDVYKVEPKVQGIGGGTVAAFLRRRGFSTVVWSTLMGFAHQPNERSSIANTIGDAKVMAHMIFQK
ncbi:M20 family metallo-hydrolase [Desulfohalobiaceae bacterium Ax17]|uniref:M20 family metallo-hydrolase n=1 Tax=Desulfovulcanus ferrireducens TaxID=2831190 RepID=UPI00207BB7EC|nr:M20 family metallo-hydrolase [Desulfovulcanus ferrireducens]MBT8762414.1 M20 family metallo-hydrolase [Desulfovulcanus ferrireducens]